MHSSTRSMRQSVGISKSRSSVGSLRLMKSRVGPMGTLVNRAVTSNEINLSLPGWTSPRAFFHDFSKTFVEIGLHFLKGVGF